MVKSHQQVRLQDISTITSMMEGEQRKILSKLGKRPMGESLMPEEHKEVLKKTYQA